MKVKHAAGGGGGGFELSGLKLNSFSGLILIIRNQRKLIFGNDINFH